jgi:hypothetical protein
MVRSIIGALALAGAAVVAGPAAADTWSAAYTGTIVATYADGHSVKVFTNADHTFKIQPATGDPLTGTWKDDGAQSCFTITAPAAAAGGPPVCMPAKEYKVGDSFDGKDSVGAFHAVINAGR